MAGCSCFIFVIRQNNIFNDVKMCLNNICNTVMSGQGSSSSGGPLWSARKKPGRGLCLTSQSKHILTSVRSYFEEEKWTGKSLMKNRPLDRTATAISKAIIKRIYQTMNEDKEILTPTKQYIKSRITINPDSFDKESIRRTVHSFHVSYI